MLSHTEETVPNPAYPNPTQQKCVAVSKVDGTKGVTISFITRVPGGVTQTNTTLHRVRL